MRPFSASAGRFAHSGAVIGNAPTALYFAQLALANLRAARAHINRAEEKCFGSTAGCCTSLERAILELEQQFPRGATSA